MLNPLITPRDIAERLNRFMPDFVRRYLQGRGIGAPFIDANLLGWDRATSKITVPVFGESKDDVLGLLYATMLDGDTEMPAVSSDGLPIPELYGRETLAKKPQRVVICENEFDRLVLMSQGIPAVSVIGGPAAFQSAWAPLFESVADIFICLHRSSASDAAAKAIQNILPRAEVVRLPAAVGDCDSIAEYFVKLEHTRAEFEVLLSLAEGGSDHEESPSLRPVRFADPKQQKRADLIRRHIRLHDVASELMDLQASRGRLVGSCPFHNDSIRSFAVYPAADVYRCHECGAMGDVIMFVMNKESLSVEEALERLECFQFTHEFYGTF